MKQRITLAALAIVLGAAAASSQTATTYEGAAFDKHSPDGHWLVENYQGSVRILNAVTGDEYELADESGAQMYSPGLGNSVSNSGRVCGFTMKRAFLWADGDLSDTVLPQPSGVGSSFNGAQAFTADGRRIVGALGSKGASLTTDGLMCYPVYWDLSDDGQYLIHTLPYLAKDFAGGTPQSVIAVCVSDDGHTVAGTLVSWSGRYKFPIVFREGDDGTWTYTLLGRSDVYDESRTDELPTLPVEPVEPDYTLYMTDSDLAAYEAALEAYQEDLDNYNNGLTTTMPTYPVVADYISDAAQKAAYTAAAAQYVSEHQAWEKKWEAYATALDGITTGATFKQNNLWLSTSGRYLATSLDHDGTTTPGYFDLTETEPVFHRAATGDEAMLATGMLNDGTLLAASPVVDLTRSTKVIAPGAAPVSFHDYLAQRSPEMAQWLADNHTYTVDGTDSIVSGTVHAGQDGDVFVAFYYDYYGGTGNAVSYVIDFTATSGISTAGLPATPAPEGVYDLSGRRLASGSQTPSRPGLYIVREGGKARKVVSR